MLFHLNSDNGLAQIIPDPNQYNSENCCKCPHLVYVWLVG